MNSNFILRPAEAAARLGLSKSTLAKRRISGMPPRFVKIGMRAVGYRLSDLDEYVEGRVLSSTSMTLANSRDY